MGTRVAVDIGGTFTDVVAFDEERGEIRLGKSLSTPSDLIEGVRTGIERAAVDRSTLEFLIHGSTVVINALIERRGVETALVTTQGFRDIYEIGRINRPDAFNLHFTKHRPLVGREAVFEVPERLAADGTVIVPLVEEAITEIAEQIRLGGYRAVAVVLLHAYRNPQHEQRVGELLKAALPNVYVTLSHEISREYREFERTSTTVANAYVGPIVSTYLGRLRSDVVELSSSASLAIMQSNGGVSDISTASRQCIQMLESGPAGGVVGTMAVCEELGISGAIAFDMGGTTAKSAVIRDSTLPLASDYFLGGYEAGLPIRIPCIDIVEVGTGGGSIAWVDEAGGVHVGPQSAGAEPGPASYGRGGQHATITDATVALGHLSPQGELSGGTTLDGDAARVVLKVVADQVGLEVHHLAAGIIEIAAAAMANSVRAVTTQRGLDPRDFALFAYGGNGPLHISMVARELGVRHVVVPPNPSLFSAWGMLMADLRTDLVETRVATLEETSSDAVLGSFAALEAECDKALRDSAVAAGQIRHERAADMRYVGQEHTVTVSIPGDLDGDDFLLHLKGHFDKAHLQRYSHSAAEEPAQIVSLRVTGIGSLPKPRLPRVAEGGTEPPPSAFRSDRPIIFNAGTGPETATVLVREELLANNVITGPAAIEEPTTTTLLRPGDVARVDVHGNLHIEIGE